MPTYDRENPMKIQGGVLPMDHHGALVRCKVFYNLIGLMQFSMVFEAYDRVDQDDCIEWCYLIPEVDVDGYTIDKIEILRSVFIGKKLVEHVCARTQEGFEYLVELGEPSMIVFQDEKLKNDEQDSE